jgi:hypothetical protein
VLQQFAAGAEVTASSGGAFVRGFTLQNRGINGPAPTPVVRTISFKDAVDTVRVKVNFRFNTDSIFAASSSVQAR